MQSPFAERIALTTKARESGTPLLERWRNLEPEVSKSWKPRSEAAAPLLADAASVADLGCGHMMLESSLQPGQIYIPVDLVARDDRTIVCDFNRESLPDTAATHFAALGLLEYIYDLQKFLFALRKPFVGGVATFYTRRDTTEEQRLSNGWVNHHTEDEILAIFKSSGFTVGNQIEWQPAHFLFRLD
jgi:hypothetical protein